MLPSPAVHDADKNYTYRPEGTEAIKTELLAGRAVGISFKADQSMPTMTKEEMKAALEETLKDAEADEAQKARYIDVRAGFIVIDSVTVEELKEMILFRMKLKLPSSVRYTYKRMKAENNLSI